MSVIDAAGAASPQWGKSGDGATRPPARRQASGGSTIACAASFWRTRNAASRFA
jgi:hypothetical protein